jgi:hypothetical protein
MTTSKKINKFIELKFFGGTFNQSNEAWISEDDILKNDIAV